MVGVNPGRPTPAPGDKEPIMSPRTITIIDPRPPTSGPRRRIRLGGLPPADRDKVRDG
jgi:hypothetical protein